MLAFSLLSSCLAFAPASAPEVFAFCTSCSVALLGKRLDIVTTIAAFGVPDADLVALAHEQRPPVRVVLGTDFDKSQLGNATARAAWVGERVAQVKSLGIDGLNLDIEGNRAQRDGLTALVTELRAALSAADPSYQLSFDLGISPGGQTGGCIAAGTRTRILPPAFDRPAFASLRGRRPPLSLIHI